MNLKLFKWIGGKKWMSEILVSKVDSILSNNKNINTYIEPFCGGLGSFLSLIEILEKHEIKNIELYDGNWKLINLYMVIKNESQLLFEKYKELEQEFLKKIPLKAYKLDKTKDKIELKTLLLEARDYYNDNRFKLNQKYKNLNDNIYYDVELASRLLFLLKHNFNGIYRENKKGENNSPFNWEALVINLDLIEDKIYKLSELFNKYNVIIECIDVISLISSRSFKDNELIYYDPPYINLLEETENSYIAQGFSNKEQFKLIEFILKHNKNFIYSNYLHPKVKDYFKEYEISYLERKNIISAKASSRGDKKCELLINS